MRGNMTGDSAASASRPSFSGEKGKSGQIKARPHGILNCQAPLKIMGDTGLPQRRQPASNAIKSGNKDRKSVTPKDRPRQPLPQAPPPQEPKMVRVRYVDNALFVNVSWQNVQPTVREIMGWLVYEDQFYVKIVSDRRFQSRGGERERDSGIVLMKNLVLDLKEVRL
jgi:hypothetical protein